MTEKTNLENKSIFCPECRSVISLGELQKEKNVSLKYVFCPHCGKKIDFEDYGFENYGILESTYKFVNIKNLDNTLQIIHEDKKFSHIFKKTLHHLLARIIYIEFRKLQDELEENNSEISLNSALIKNIEKKLRGIYTQKPNIIFLRRLDKLSQKKFLSQLKKYQKKLRKDECYRKAFSIYLKWIIEMIFRIISQLDTEEGLLKPEIVIRNDLIELFAINKDRNVWNVENSFKVIDFCYRTYIDHNYNLMDILDDKNDMIKFILSALELKYTDFIIYQFFKIIKIVYYLMDSENGVTTKKDLIVKSESSERIVNRVINRLEKEFDLKLDETLKKRNLKNRRKKIMKKIHRKAKKNLIKVQSSMEEYFSSESVLNFECLMCGAKFSNTWKNINSSKYGLKCAYCDPNLNPQNKEYYAKKLKNIIESKRGKLLSEYENVKTKVLIECNEGHQWYSAPKSIFEGTWCPECYLNKKGYLKDIQDIAKSRGGKCLSNEYINAHTHLKFQCELKHTWMAKPNSIKNGTWCPRCSQGLSERICRKLFEEIFIGKFPKTTFGWLKNVNGNKMHLDGYNNELKLAFEYNGEQHYRFKDYWY